jgi:hypothetical protein
LCAAGLHCVIPVVLFGEIKEAVDHG